MKQQVSSPKTPAPRRRRLWPWSLALVLVLLALLAGGLVWVANSAAGAAWAVRTGLQVAGGSAELEDVQGSLAAGLSVGQLHIRHPAADVDVESLHLDMLWRALWSGRAHLAVLEAKRLRLNVKPSDQVSEPLSSLSLPIGVDLDRVRIGKLDIETDGLALPLTLGDIDLQGSSSGDRHQLELTNLHILAPQAQATVSGHLKLGAASPFPLDLDLLAVGRQAERAFNIHAVGSGSLERMDFVATGDGAGVDVDARGQLALLAGFPLRELTLNLKGIDPAAWVADAPRANLSLTADLTVLADAPSAATAPVEAVVRGPFRLSNAAARPLNEGGLPITHIGGEIRVPVESFASLAVSSLDIGLPGDGRVTGQIQWTRSSEPGDALGQIEGKLRASNIDASRIHASALPTRLSGPVDFSANAAQQALTAELNERGQRVPVALKLAAQLKESVLTVSQAELTAGEARARATGELQLSERQKFSAKVRLDRFDPAHWVRDAGLPSAQVSASASIQGSLQPELAGSALVDIDDGSRWNGEPLDGLAKLDFVGTRVSRMDAKLNVAGNFLKAEGAFGHPGDRLTFDLDAPRLAGLSPLVQGSLKAKGMLAETLSAPVLNMRLEGSKLQLPGGVRIAHVQGHADLGDASRAAQVAKGGFAAAPADIDLLIEGLTVSDVPQASMKKGTLRLAGTMARHDGDINAEFVPSDGTAAATLVAHFGGSWGNGGNGRDAPGWRGTLDRFDAVRAPFGVVLKTPLTLSYLPEARAPGWQWEAGAAQLALQLPGGQTGVLLHEGSRGGEGRWESRGKAEGLAWAPDLLMDLVEGKAVPADHMVVLDANWDVKFAGALQGAVHVQRRSGDLWVPGSPPQALGLRSLSADLLATPAGGGGRSRVTLKANVDGERFGHVSISGEAGVVAQGGGVGLDKDRPAFADTDIDLRDLSWIGLFTGDAIEIGGALAGKARIAQEGGQWQARGGFNGTGIRLVRLDDGVRLLDGSLKATLENDRIVLESLRFPSVIRVRPRDTRVMKWIENESQGGELEITADWRISQASGHATIKALRFPAIQRADRFVAGSGRVDMDLVPGRMRIAGLFEADTGWIDLGTEAPPSLSDDVYVWRTNDRTRPEPLQVAIDVGAKLGKRFYLEGYGLDTGVTGDLRVVGVGSELSSSGTVRTTGGRFEAYGQALTVRRGVLTFQGPIDDPLLDIVALRTGTRVEAGVQVSGTARHPRIALISQPEVSDVEKLSWLLLGRGPDEGGGGADATLLLSAATSLLGPKGSEPISRQLGLDELGVRSGNVGSSRGLLPDRTVAGDSTSSAYALSTNQFFVVGKRLSDKVYGSFEQALSGRDGVVKLSYRLSNRLSVVAKGGTINGLDLLYYVFFND